MKILKNMWKAALRVNSDCYRNQTRAVSFNKLIYFLWRISWKGEAGLQGCLGLCEYESREIYSITSLQLQK